MNFRSMTTVIFCCLSFFALSSGLAFAEEDEDVDILMLEFGEEDSLATMMQLLEAETEIATKTKMNADYVPGMVTILQGRELETMGAINVHDALQFVPGMHLEYTGIGNGEVRTRGINGGPKIKLLINGLPIHNTLNADGNGYAISLLNVERLEVIRGPGSAIHGGNAYSAVINVVLRDNANRVAVVASDQQRAAANISLSDRHENYQLNLHYYANRMEPSTPIQQDILHTMGQAGISNAPKNVNNWFGNHQAFLQFQTGDFSLQGTYLKTDTGDGYGVRGALSSVADAGWLRAVDMALFASYQHEWDNSNIMARLGYSKHNIQMHLPIFPTGFAVPLPANNPLSPLLGGVLTYPLGMTQDLNYEEHQQYATLEWQQQLDSHQVLFGLDYRHTAPRDLWQRTNFDPTTSLPFSTTTFQALGMRGYTGAQNWMREGVSRRNIAAYLQDTISISKQFDLTGGIRYDNFSDTDNSVTPRLAAVYRFTDAHIFKAQFATAFRPPTLMEMYIQSSTLKGDPTLQAETSKTFELGYIYKSINNVARLTLFSSNLRNVIVDLAGQFTNIGAATTRGAELELEHSLSSRLKITGNLSYSRARDTQANVAITNSTPWLANGIVSYQPMHDVMLQVFAHYVGQRQRAVGDSRPALSAFTTVDTTITLANVLTRGLDLHFGVRNMFDELALTPLAANYRLQDFQAYSNQRSFWSEVSWSF
ncbi:MAG: TonB-dependent receptor [Mariprofundales bacterium]